MILEKLALFGLMTSSCYLMNVTGRGSSTDLEFINKLYNILIQDNYKNKSNKINIPFPKIIMFMKE